MPTQVTLDFTVPQVGPVTSLALQADFASVALPLDWINGLGARVISDVVSAGPPIRRRVVLGFEPSSPAAATAVLAVGRSGEPIARFNVSAPGADYVVPPIVSIGSDGDGLGAFGRALLKVVSAARVTGGTGYDPTTTAVFFGGLPPYNQPLPPQVGAPTHTKRTFREVVSANLIGGGAGYSQFTRAVFTGGLSPNPKGTPATAGLTIRGGVITAIKITDRGRFYVSPPAVSFFDPTGSGSGATATVLPKNMTDGQVLYYLGTPATANLTIVAGVVTGVALVDGGSGYVSPPVLQAIDPTGAGSGASFSLSMGVGQIDVQAPGRGYVRPPTVTLVPLFESLFPAGGGQEAVFANVIRTALQQAVRTPVTAVFPVLA